MVTGVNVCSSRTKTKNKFEDIKQMQATNLPHIIINESLKICYNLPHKFVTTGPAVMMASFGPTHYLIENYNNLGKTVTTSPALP